MSKESETEELSKTELRKMIRGLLLIGIVAVAGAMVYSATRPEEEDVLFFILNDQQDLKDYPTNASVDKTVTVYGFVENHLGKSAEFTVQVYQSSGDVVIHVNTSVAGHTNITDIKNFTKTLENEEEWLTDQIDVSFPAIGENQLIILELWQKMDGEWAFMPNYLLFIRLNITA